MGNAQLLGKSAGRLIPKQGELFSVFQHLTILELGTEAFG
jgi:hypothetical protein